MLKLLKESDGQEVDPHPEFPMEPSEFDPTSEAKAEGIAMQPDGLDASDDKPAPDWLTELATEEGFTDSLEELKVRLTKYMIQPI